MSCCRTGLGDDTAVVPVIQDCDLHKVGIEACRQEFRDTCFGAIEELLEKTGNLSGCAACTLSICVYLVYDLARWFFGCIKHGGTNKHV